MKLVFEVTDTTILSDKDEPEAGVMPMTSELLEQLGRERDQWFEEIARDPKQTRFGYVVLILNNTALNSKEKMKTPIKDGDKLVLVTPSEGG